MRSQRMEKGDHSKPHPVSDRQKKNGFALGCNRAYSGSVSFVFLVLITLFFLIRLGFIRLGYRGQ